MLDVLLIDDDEDEFFIFSDAIKCFPDQMRCIYAHRAEQAFSMLEYLRPKVIFVDMNMPRISGIDCIKRLNDINKGHAQLIIMYSTHMDDALCEKAKKAGASDCLKKTDSIPVLVEKLTQYLLVSRQTSVAGQLNSHIV